MSTLTIGHPEPMAKKDLELRRIQTRALLDLGRIRQATERLVETSLAEHGLEQVTPAQANALLVLVNAREPLAQAQLARALSISEVTAGRFVHALEHAGWVERTRDPGDSRAWRLAPTAKARQALPRFIAVSNQLLDAAFSGMDEDQVRLAADWLGRVRRNLDGG